MIQTPDMLEPEIVVRKIDRRPGPDTPHYWFADHAFETHFFNALSSTFPEGERFFILSVRTYASRVSDPKLKAQIVAFTGQEGQHSREHEDHVALLVSQGYPLLAKLNKTMRAVTRWFARTLPRYSLALTTAIEHVTAVLADELMHDESQHLAHMSDEMRFMWHWHAVEETEHKAVAYDVYQTTGGDYPLRVLAMLQTIPGFMLEICLRHCYLLAKDGVLFDIGEWRRGSSYLWGTKGILRALMKGTAPFFRRDFHPWQQQNHAYIERFEQRYGVDYFNLQEEELSA